MNWVLLGGAGVVVLLGLADTTLRWLLDRYPSGYEGDPTCFDEEIRFL